MNLYLYRYFEGPKQLDGNSKVRTVRSDTVIPSPLSLFIFFHIYFLSIYIYELAVYFPRSNIFIVSLYLTYLRLYYLRII